MGNYDVICQDCGDPFLAEKVYAYCKECHKNVSNEYELVRVMKERVAELEGEVARWTGIVSNGYAIDASRTVHLEAALDTVVTALEVVTRKEINGYDFDKLLSDSIESLKKLGGWQNCYAIEAMRGARLLCDEALAAVRKLK